MRPPYKMLFSIILTTALWSTVSSFEIDSTERNCTVLEELFKKKYMAEGVGYTKWQKLHDASQVEITNVCSKYALMLSRDERIRTKTEAKAYFRDQYLLFGYNQPVELDTLTCLVGFLDKKGKKTSTMKYYLAEGDEPDSAFRFGLVQTSMVLTRKLTNIWARETGGKGDNVLLKINRTSKSIVDKLEQDNFNPYSGD